MREAGDESTPNVSMTGLMVKSKSSGFSHPQQEPDEGHQSRDEVF